MLSYPNVIVVVSEVHNPFTPDSIFFNLATIGAKSNKKEVILRGPFGSLFFKDLTCKQDSCYTRTVQAVNELNRALTDAQGTRVQIAAVYENFANHSSPNTGDQLKTCSYSNKPGTPDPQTTWIQQPLDGLSNSYPWRSSDNDKSLTRLRNNLFLEILGDWKGDCFHPNDTGVLEYANAVYDAAIGLLGH